MVSRSASNAPLTRWLARLPARLRRHDVEAAYLFGSRACGEGDEHSDVDLLIVAPSRRPFVERFRDYPDLIAAPVGVDLFVYTPAEFARERRVNRFVRHAVRGRLV